MVAVMAVAQRPSPKTQHPKTQSLKILHQTQHQTQHLAVAQIQAPTPTIGRSCL